MAALPAPALPDPEVGRLQRVLADVRFLLERGCWQAALTVARDEKTPAISQQTQAVSDA
jgi:hypothetical protein